MFLTILYYQFFPDSEVKSLLLQLRKLLKVKKPKMMSKLKKLFRKRSSDWRDVTYLKGVENLHNIPSLVIDEDSDSISSMSTATTDLDDDDTGSVRELAVGYSAVGSPAVVGVPAVANATNVIDMAFHQIDPPEAGPSQVNPLDVDPAFVEPFKVDWTDNTLKDYFVFDCELMNVEPTNDERVDLESTDSESSADDDLINWTDGESAYEERIGFRPMGDESTDDESEWTDDDSSEFDRSDTSCECYRCRRDFRPRAANARIGLQQPVNMEAPGYEPLNSDDAFLLFVVRSRIRVLDPNARINAFVAILRALQEFELHRSG